MSRPSRARALLDYSRIVFILIVGAMQNDVSTRPSQARGYAFAVIAAVFLSTTAIFIRYLS